MKLAAVTSLFKYYPLPEALRVIAASGYEGVELWGGLPHAYVDDFYINGALDDKTVSACRTLMSESGLNPVQFLPEQCFYPVNFVIGDAPPFDGARLRARAIDYFERSINLASALGFQRMCMTTPFWGWTESDGHWSHTPKHNMPRIIETIGHLTRHAETQGVEIVLEPLSFLETTGVETLPEVLTLLDGVASSSLKIMLDTGHIHVTATALGKSSDAYLDEHIDALGKNLVHIHLSDNFGDLDAHLIPGKGSFNFSHAIASLKASGYDGYLSAEIMMFGANPVPPAPGELLVATRQYMESLVDA